MSTQVRGWAAILAILLVTASFGWLLVRPPHAEPVRDRILDRVYLTELDGRVAVQVDFPCPVRYVTHFPQHAGRELRVLVVPVPPCEDNQEAVRKREAIRPPYADVAGLSQVVYEGDIEQGPFVTFEFTQKVAYEVIPGSDHRGLTVFIEALLREGEGGSPSP